MPALQTVSLWQYVLNRRFLSKIPSLNSLPEKVDIKSSPSSMRLKDTIRLIPYLASLKSLAVTLDVDLYLVGGFLRDLYLGDIKACRDFDFIVATGAFSFAQEFAKKTNSKIIVLDEDEKTYRVIMKKSDAHYYYDFAEMRGGSLNDPRFDARQTGEGGHARLLARRFEIACRRFGLDGDRPALDCTRFRVPGRTASQPKLFS